MTDKDRRIYIGGGDIAAIMGRSKWRTARQVYDAKVGTGSPVPETRIMERGRDLEPFVLGELAERRFPDWIVQSHDGSTLFRDEPWLGGTPDGFVHLPDRPGMGVLEVKTMATWPFKHLLRDGLSDDYILQGQWYCWLTAAPFCQYLVLQPDTWELLPITVERDDLLIEAMVAAARAFWLNHVVPHIPPEDGPPLPEGDVAMEPSDAQQVDVQSDIGQRLVRYAEAKDVAEEAEAWATVCKDDLLAALPGHGIFETGLLRAHYTQVDGKETFDSKKFKKDHPELAAQYTRTGKPFAMLRLVRLRAQGDSHE